MKLKQFWRRLGPGLITGASDDDPAGVVIYAQTGAQTGFTMLWSALLSFPLMAAVQEMCARIGLVTGHGLAGNIKRNYPRFILLPVVVLVVAGNTLNIGADLAAMAATSHLLLPLPEPVLAIIYAVIVILTMIFISYRTLANILKWFTLSLLAYIAVPFFVQTDWYEAIYRTVAIQLQFNRETLVLLVAILGTTISPYLFFWQTSNEVEDKLSRLKRLFTRWIVTKHELKGMRADVTVGMLFSNTVMWFIIVATAVTLNSAGITNIETTKDAAEALRPFVGNLAYLIFSLGVVSVGLLAIPVLAGASSYALSETMGWREGLERRFSQAKQFYWVIIASTVVGVMIPIVGVDPVKALIYTGVFYGLTSPILILLILHVANNPKIMGRHTNKATSNFLGVVALLAMTVAGISIFII